MTELKDILAQRRCTHGDYTDNARVAQTLLGVMAAEPGWQRLSDVQKETMWMFAHKQARILGGDPNVHDHWDDIAGYAKLTSDRIPRPTVAELEEILRDPDDGATVHEDGSVTRPSRAPDPQKPQYKIRDEKLREVGLGDAATSWGERADRLSASTRGAPEQPGTPADGGHHEGARMLVDPWIISATRARRHLPSIGLETAYRSWHRDYCVLEPAISTEQRLELSRVGDSLTGEARTFLRAVVALYDREESWYVLRIASAPAADRELWPTLRRELNSKEHEEQPAWQRVLYRRDEEAAKWILRDEHAAWTRE